MNIIKYFKNLSILATGLVIANTGFGGPDIGPYTHSLKIYELLLELNLKLVMIIMPSRNQL